MAAGTTQSGTEGRCLIGAVEFEITKWTFKEAADSEDYASSKTEGKKKVVGGNSQASGAVEFKRVTEDGFRAEQLARANTKVALVLKHDSDSGWTIPSAFISNLNLECDNDTGAIQGGSFDYKSDGDYTPAVS